MRLGLVPVGDRGVVVAPLVGVAVLDADPYRLPERYRVLYVKAVVAYLPAPVLFAFERDPVIRRGVPLVRAPGGVEVVLGTGAVQRGRPAFSVYKDHVVSLSVPVPTLGLAQVVYVQHAPYVVSPALGFEDSVVPLTVPVLAAKQKLLVVLVSFFDSVGRVLPTPLGVEAAQPLLQLVELLVVYVVVEEHVAAAKLALNLYTSA